MCGLHDIYSVAFVFGFCCSYSFWTKKFGGGGEGGGKGSCFMIGIGYDSLAQCKLFVYLRVRFVF